MILAALLVSSRRMASTIRSSRRSAVFLGRHDYTTPSSITVAWMQQLTAPKKQIVWFENSAHLMEVDEPGRVFAALLQDVLPLAR